MANAEKTDPVPADDGDAEETATRTKHLPRPEI